MTAGISDVIFPAWHIIQAWLSYNYFGPCATYMRACVCNRLCFVFIVSIYSCIGLTRATNEMKGTKVLNLAAVSKLFINAMPA